MIVKDNTVKKFNPIISDDEAKKKKVTLLNPDGTAFGEVSLSAYNALTGEYLDKYSPLDNNEKSTLEKYQKEVIDTQPIEITLTNGEETTIQYGTAKKIGDYIDSYIKSNKNKNAKELTRELTSRTVPLLKNLNLSGNEYKAARDYMINLATAKAKDPASTASGVLKAVPYVAEKTSAGVLGFGENLGKYALAGLQKLGSLVTTGDVSKRLDDDAGKTLATKTLSEQWSESADERYRVHDVTRSLGGTFEALGNLAVPIATEIATYGASPLGDIALASFVAKNGAKALIKTAPKVVKASEVLFGLSAAGSAASEGYRKSGDTGKSLIYGAASGMAEMATERLFGGFAGTDIGESLIDFTVKNPYIRKALNFATEPLEEVIVTAADPFFQRATVDKDAAFASLKDYGESAKQGVLLTALMGIATYPIKRHSVKKNVDMLNAATDSINSLLVDDQYKLAPLSYRATEEDMQKRQGEIKALTREYTDFVETEVSKFAEWYEAQSKAAPTEETSTTVAEDDYALSTNIEYLGEADRKRYMNVGNQHTRHRKEHLLKTGVDPLLVSKENTDDFIINAIKGGLDSQIRAFSKANDKMISDVKLETNGEIDIEGYFLELNSDDIYHVGKHLVENIPQQSDLTIDDVKNIPEYMVNYDHLINVHRQKDGRIVMTVGKRINGHSVIVSIVSSGRKSLVFKTAYNLSTEKYNAIVGIKKDAKSQEATESQSETMPNTPNNVPTIASSIKTISQDKDIVKNSIHTVDGSIPATSLSQDIKSLEESLKKQGVAPVDRESIVGNSERIARALQGTGKSISQVVSGVTKMTNNIARSLAKQVGNVQNYYALLDANLQALSNVENMGGVDFISTYTDTYLDALRANDAVEYEKVSGGTENVSVALTNYIMTGRVPINIQNYGSFAKAANDIKTIVKDATRMIGMAYTQIYGKNPAVASKVQRVLNGDFSADGQNAVLQSENSNGIIETSTGAKVSYALNGNTKQGKKKSGQRRFATNNQQMQVFPPYNESQSEANEISTRWAHREDVDDGAMKIAFYHDGIYLIEKTSGSDLGYRIIRKITKKEYDKWLQKNRGVQYGKDTGKQSNGKDVGQSRGGNRGNDTDGRVKSGSNRDSVRHRGKVQDVSGVDSHQEEWRGTEYERNGDYEHRFKDKQKSSGIIETSTGAKVSYALNDEYWHTDLTKRQVKILEECLRRVGKPSATTITDTANWFMGRIDGYDVFAIYSTEDAKGPTILYETKTNAKLEKNILMDILEAKENGKSDIGRKRDIDRLLGGDWVQGQRDMANSNAGPRKGGSHTGNAAVLQGKSPQFVGSKAFRNVIKNLFKIQESARSNEGVSYSLEGEVNKNEQRNLLSDGSQQRDIGEYSGEQVTGLAQATERGAKTAAKRKAYTKGLGKESLEERILTDEEGNKHRYTEIKQEAWNKEMRDIAGYYGSKGVTVHFLKGNVVITFTGQNKTAKAMRTGSDIYISYDNFEYSPQQLAMHEYIHSKYDTPEVQAVKEEIFGKLSEEKRNTMLECVKSAYGDVTKDSRLYEEEVVCNILSGMYRSESCNETVQNFWTNENSGGQGYAVSQYAESVDAGGNNNMLESGENNGSQNTKTLAEHGVGQNNDSVWQRSNDSEGLYRSVGNGKTLLRRSEEKGFGLIDWSRKFGTLNVNDPKEKGYAYGFLRKISELKIADDDSLGRKLPKVVKDYFGQTVLKNSSGEIVPLYHATDEKFDIFNYGDFGFHIGNWEQATYLNKEFIKEVYVNVKNPMYIPVDSMHWYGMVIANRALSQDIINRKEYDSISKLDGFFGMDYDSEANIAMRELLKEKGYDGIIYNNGFEGKDISIMAFDSNQIKYTSNQNPTSRSEINYALDENGMWEMEHIFENDDPEAEAAMMQEWADALEKYGTIPKGENPARDIDVPKKISKKDVVSRFARTMMEAGVTPDETVSEFEKRILDGTMTHEVITNERASANAKARIERNGFEEALRDWDGIARQGIISKENLAFGMELYNQCIAQKDVRNAMKIAADLVAEATRAGQTLQATRMLKTMSPDGQLYYLEKSVQKMNEEFREKLGKKYRDIVLDETLMERFLTEKNEEKRNAVYDEICQNIADQIPATFLDKWNSWRYLAMLGNLRTHLRNIIGNAVFVPAIRIKNYVGAVIEHGMKVDVAERTKGFRKSKEAVAFAEKDFEVMQKILQGENAKYAVTGDIEGKRTIFKTKWLEKLRIKNFDFLEMEDMWFLKAHYVDALARLITVRGLDVNNITSKDLDVARAYAVKEAQAATYRDANALAEGLARVQRQMERSDHKLVRGASVAVEGVMPFKKTPLNIAKQGIAYSPVSIMTGTYKSMTKLKNGTATTSEVIDDFAKGLTGTGLMLLGLFLAKLGLLSGSEDENKKKREFNKMVGEQSYALKIGDTSYTIDWMMPACLPLFVGQELYELTKEDFSFADVVDAMTTLAEPLMELSVFSGISDMIDAAKYGEANAVFSISSDVVASYFMQAFPTIGGQVSRVIDKNRREYYYKDKTSPLPLLLQSLIGQASSKVPFASYLFAPSVDEWGREEKYGNVFERLFENTLSPGYFSKENYTAVDNELLRLYDKTGENSVLPVIQEKYYKKDNISYPMSAEDYAEVKRIRGQKSFTLVRKLMQSSKYRKMSDGEKVKAIKKCYDQAGDETKEKMFEKVKRNAGKR